MSTPQDHPIDAATSDAATQSTIPGYSSHPGAADGTV